MNIASHIFEVNKKMPNNIALSYDNQNLTYEQLCNKVITFSHEMKKLNINKRDEVLIFLPNSFEFAISVFSTFNIGAVVILADTKYNDELLTIFDENNIKLIITDNENLDKVKKYAKEKLYNKNKYSLITLEYKDDIKSIELNQISLMNDEVVTSICTEKSLQDNCYIFEENVYDEKALILYSSGSVGRPKGIINTHKTLCNALINYKETINISPKDVFVGVTPFFHSYCFGSCFLCALSSGAKIVLQKKFIPRKILRLIKDEKCTIFQGVPFMYKLISEHYTKESDNIETLRFCVSAGGPLSRMIAEEFYKKTSKIIHQEYGSTETGTMALNCFDDFEKNIISVGKSLQNVNVRLVNLDENNIGEIEIKSEGMAIGYLNKQPFERSWYSTGDLGKIDKDGFIYIVGRIKKLISISGLKINPTEVEQVLEIHPYVDQVLVKGEEDEEYGEIVKAIVKRNNPNLSKEELKEFCKSKLATYKIPRRIEWTERFEKTSLGKIKNSNK